MPSEADGNLAGLLQALLETDGLEQFLRELSVLAARAVRDGTSCGVALQQRGRPSPVTASSDPLASEANQLQLQAGAGPVLDALRHARPVSVPDTRLPDLQAPGTQAPDWWPLFCRPAAALGIRSCYALPLLTGGEPGGALVLYARQPGAFGPDATARAGRFAGPAAGALTLAQRSASWADQNEQLRASIASRAIIDQALGVIMATERCPQDKAFATLRGASQNTNVKLRDLAASIVMSVSGESPRLTAPFEEG